MTELECPYCGTIHTSGKAITGKVRCPRCNKSFRTSVQEEPGTAPDLRSLLDEFEPPPPASAPAQASPLTRPKVKPKKKELHGYRSMFLENSRTFTAVVLCLGIGTAIYALGVWFVDKQRELDITTRKTAQAKKERYEKGLADKSVKAKQANQQPQVLPQMLAKPGPTQEVQPAQGHSSKAVDEMLERMKKKSAEQQITAPPRAYAPLGADLQGVPPPVARKRADPDQEKRAAGRLKYAKRLGREGKSTSKAKELQELVDRYPDTDAAEEAREILGISDKDRKAK